MKRFSVLLIFVLGCGAKPLPKDSQTSSDTGTVVVSDSGIVDTENPDTDTNTDSALDSGNPFDTAEPPPDRNGSYKLVYVGKTENLCTGANLEGQTHTVWVEDYDPKTSKYVVQNDFFGPIECEIDANDEFNCAGQNTVKVDVQGSSLELAITTSLSGDWRKTNFRGDFMLEQECTKQSRTCAKYMEEQKIESLPCRLMTVIEAEKQ